MKKERGFTLVELIVIMVIIGIAAGLSIPKYQKMVYKGNQQGAVAGLTSIYMAQKNFAAENHTYTTCIKKIGITDPPGRRYYSYGFNTAWVQASCGMAGNASCNTSAWDEGAVVENCAAADGYIAADTRSAPETGTPLPTNVHLGTTSGDMTNTAFTARAAGNIGSVSGYDRWTIDQSGTPINNVQLF
jgi:prepilin-type N-terminal cleavage/methylation domain-containing protein